MNRVEVLACQTGVTRHAPGLSDHVHAAGGRFSAVECFDKCETCERVLLVKVGGVMMRCSALRELTEAIAAMEVP